MTDVAYIDGGADARDAAALRWKAIEGLTYAPGLSPAARRVGIALICTMDSRTRACFPSETRLAALCDMHVSAVRKAKAELKKAGFIDWFNPGGPRHQSHYGFAWEKLELESEKAKVRADEAVEAKSYQPSKVSKHTHTGINGTQRIHTRTGRNDGAIPTQNASIPTQNQPPTYPYAASNIPVRVAELSHYPPLTPQPEHDAAPACAASAAVAPSSPIKAPPLNGHGSKPSDSRPRAREEDAAAMKQKAEHLAWVRQREEKLRLAKEAGYTDAFIDWNDNGALKMPNMGTSR